MKQLKCLFHKLFSKFGYDESSDSKTEVKDSQNPMMQPVIEDNQVSVFNVTVADDTTINTDAPKAEQNSITLSPKESIEFTEIEPISIKEVQPSNNDSVKVVNIPEGDFDKLLATTIETIKYYDQIAEQVQNQDAKTLLNDVCAKLIENLVMSGCTPINEPTGIFDMTKHKTTPFQIVPEDTTYTNLVRPGIEYNGEVKILAIVEL